MYIHAEVKRRARRKRRYNHSGDYGRKVPPVPIPNTEVKLSYAESTLRDTAWEDRSSPFSVALLSLKQIEGNFFILYIKTADVPMRPRFFVDSIQRDGERVWARIVIDKQAKQEMKLCEKRGTESKKVEKDREKLLKTIGKNSLE